MITFLTLLAIASGILSLGSFMAGVQALRGATLFVNVQHLELMGLGFALGMVGCIVGACLVAKLEQIRTQLAGTSPRMERGDDPAPKWHWRALLDV